ncbi:hypothetical protein KSX_87710 [Ktedonospora formicarum]|uniref:Uncharacterized protein n=2 Tax=Ktedonospora formicarum TaxID=2778364 RepID=A0A8J3MYB1_9CHLR|nr:hypothetical protein KSX_87710 [Ktedonospora formicarum]
MPDLEEALEDVPKHIRTVVSKALHFNTVVFSDLIALLVGLTELNGRASDRYCYEDSHAFTQVFPHTCNCVVLAR